MPASNLIADLSNDQKTAFRRSPIAFGHGLSETRLFDDDALARLIDACPPALRDIRRIDGGVERRTLSGQQVLEGVRQGRLEVRLRQVEAVLPVFATLLRKISGEIRGQASGMGRGLQSGRLVISPAKGWIAPNVEGPPAVLFHLRGRERVWVYPALAAPRDVKGRMYDLKAGAALALPSRTPYRVEALDEINVSLSVAPRSWISRLIDTAGLAGMRAPRLLDRKARKRQADYGPIMTSGS